MLNILKYGANLAKPVLKPIVASAKALQAATMTFARAPSVANAKLLAKQLANSKKAVGPALAMVGAIGAKIALLKALFEETKEDKYLRMIEELMKKQNSTPTPPPRKRMSGIQKRSVRESPPPKFKALNARLKM